ncbi:MAG: hypothetical protein ACTSP1_15470, partial [Candidatus Freyarchaeota archaeon]
PLDFLEGLPEQAYGSAESGFLCNGLLIYKKGKRPNLFIGPRSGLMEGRLIAEKSRLVYGFGRV